MIRVIKNWRLRSGSHQLLPCSSCSFSISTSSCSMKWGNGLRRHRLRPNLSLLTMAPTVCSNRRSFRLRPKLIWKLLPRRSKNKQNRLLPSSCHQKNQQAATCTSTRTCYLRSTRSFRRAHRRRKKPERLLRFGKLCPRIRSNRSTCWLSRTRRDTPAKSKNSITRGTLRWMTAPRALRNRSEPDCESWWVLLREGFWIRKPMRDGGGSDRYYEFALIISLSAQRTYFEFTKIKWKSN